MKYITVKGIIRLRYFPKFIIVCLSQTGEGFKISAVNEGWDALSNL